MTTMLRHRSSLRARNDDSSKDDNDAVGEGGSSSSDVPRLLEALSAAAVPRRMMRVAFADEVRSEKSSHFEETLRKPAMVSSVPSSLLSINPMSLGANVPVAVPVTTAEDEDVVSVGSGSYASLATTHKTMPKWSTRYTPPPVLSQSALLSVGLLCFALAYVWPPLILLLAYIASKIVPYSYRLNDDATYRRRLYKEFASQEDSHPAHFYSPPDGITIDESFWVNDRGMALSTMIMRPPAPQSSEEDSSPSEDSTRQPKAVVCFCHGYSDNLSYSKKMEYQRLAKAGIAVVGIEYEGHGRSDGALCLIENWDRMIGDVAAFFQQTIQRQFSNVPVFLMGESMGGAVAYAVYNSTPTLYKGVVFVCPMCKISDDMLPPQFVIDALKWIVGPTGSESTWIGHLPIAPSKSDLYETAHHVPEKAEQIYRCPTSYGRNPRLVTARELLHATSEISASLSKFDAPFLIVHGREDRVTDPQLSLSLYRESQSRDKSIRLYDGMWHGITSTEPDDNIDRVFKDCTNWILERCSRRQQPSQSDDDDDDCTVADNDHSQQ